MDHAIETSVTGRYRNVITRETCVVLQYRQVDTGSLLIYRENAVECRRTSRSVRDT